jgi:hypothetical protein
MPFINAAEAAANFNQTKAQSQGGYLSISKLPVTGGAVRFFILSEESQIGQEAWFKKLDGTGSISRRFKKAPSPALIAEYEKELAATIDHREGKPPTNGYMAFFVYDYEAAAVKLLSITQTSVITAILNSVSDPDFQPLSDWDIEITRKGALLDTRYTVVLKKTLQRDPDVKAEVAAAWAEAQKAGFDLDQYLLNGNPFGKSA